MTNHPSGRTISAMALIAVSKSSISIIAISHTAPSNGTPFHHMSRSGDVGGVVDDSEPILHVACTRDRDEVGRDIDTDDPGAEASETT